MKRTRKVDLPEELGPDNTMPKGRRNFKALSLNLFRLNIAAVNKGTRGEGTGEGRAYKMEEKSTIKRWEGRIINAYV